MYLCGNLLLITVAMEFMNAVQFPWRVVTGDNVAVPANIKKKNFKSTAARASGE